MTIFSQRAVLGSIYSMSTYQILEALIMEPLKICESERQRSQVLITNQRIIFFPAENAPPLPPRPSRPEQATASPALPPRRPQRYFCVPFIRRSNQYRDSEFKKQGSW